MRDSGGGSIVNLGSVSWMIGEADCIAYVTAKSAVNGLTRGLARELGPENIRVNCVVPGWVMTKRQIELWVTPEGERQIDERQCLKGRLNPPTSPAWCCGSLPTTAACARRRISSSMRGGSEQRMRRRGDNRHERRGEMRFSQRRADAASALMGVH